MVSMAVINSHTAINRDFESYELMKRHNDLATMIEKLEFDPDRPTFYLLNAGETHYPYLVPGDDLSTFPHISGLHGAVAGLTRNITETDADNQARRALSLDRLLTLEEMYAARDRQIHTVSYVDNLFGKLFEKVPRDTYIVVTSDHGDLFGEDGMFGHGSVIHPKVLEVPLAEGLVP
jgi:arylsulfatase A-like enzyme